MPRAASFAQILALIAAAASVVALSRAVMSAVALTICAVSNSADISMSDPSIAAWAAAVTAAETGRIPCACGAAVIGTHTVGDVAIASSAAAGTEVASGTTNFTVGGDVVSVAAGSITLPVAG